MVLPHSLVRCLLSPAALESPSFPTGFSSLFFLSAGWKLKCILSMLCRYLCSIRFPTWVWSSVLSVLLPDAVIPALWSFPHCRLHLHA